MSTVSVFVFPSAHRSCPKVLTFADRFAAFDLARHSRRTYRLLRSAGASAQVARMATIGSLAALHGVNLIDSDTAVLA